MIDHVGFDVRDYEASKSFYREALAPRPLYHDHYYGAYVLDPDGNNVEAVCRAPE